MQNIGVLTFITNNGLSFPNKIGIFNDDRVFDLYCEYLLYDQDLNLRIVKEHETSLFSLYKFNEDILYDENQSNHNQKDYYYGINFIGKAYDNFDRAGFFGCGIIFKNHLPLNLDLIFGLGKKWAKNYVKNSLKVTNLPLKPFFPEKIIIKEEIDSIGYISFFQEDSIKEVCQNFFEKQMSGRYGQIYLGNDKNVQYLNHINKERKILILNEATFREIRYSKDILIKNSDLKKELNKYNQEKKDIRKKNQSLIKENKSLKESLDKLKNLNKENTADNLKYDQLIGKLKKEENNLKSLISELEKSNEDISEKNKKIKNLMSELEDIKNKQFININLSDERFNDFLITEFQKNPDSFLPFLEHHRVVEKFNKAKNQHTKEKKNSQNTNKSFFHVFLSKIIESIKYVLSIEV